MSLLTFLLLAAGCAYPEETFLDDFDAASCDWQTDCFSYQEHAECLRVAVDSRTGIPDSCTYDPDAAQECVQDYAAIDCPAGSSDAALPAACASVWDCD